MTTGLTTLNNSVIVAATSDLLPFSSIFMMCASTFGALRTHSFKTGGGDMVLQLYIERDLEVSGHSKAMAKSSNLS